MTLELNGRKIGEQIIQPDKITARFDLAYQPGLLIAKSYTADKETGSDTLRTTGKPSALRLTADRINIKANRNDLSYIKVEVVDERGMVVPYIESLIRYRIQGVGSIAGVGNGDPADVSSFQRHEKKVYRGKGLVIIRPDNMRGKIILTAEAPGLRNAQIIITAH